MYILNEMFYLKIESVMLLIIMVIRFSPLPIWQGNVLPSFSLYCLSNSSHSSSSMPRLVERAAWHENTTKCNEFS